jgi:hypothetical protein
MMKRMLGKTVVWMVVAGALFSGMASAQDFEGLRDAMTPEELEAAGLDSLSPEQQQFLDGWLRQRFTSPPSAGAMGQTATHDLDPGSIHDGGGSVAAGDNGAIDAAVTGDDAIEAEIERRVALEVNAAIAKAAEEDAAEKAARVATRDEPFEADIVGPFSGWGGKTVFTLSNGQVWRQRTGSNYRHTAAGQTVAVKKNFIGLWTLTVLSSGRTVGVYRID